MIQLTLRNPLDCDDDVARMSAMLNKSGYNASNGDIKIAYQMWSVDNYNAIWIPLDALRDDLVQSLLTKLKPIVLSRL